ncbi:hypothetical protein AMECASPLE_010656 [Ameca splendens]|uniref:Uncharacterized protein n=1 Tax=Ameca splendens TaxID=208324 RepID=A0ABV0YMM0_9TELE
MFSDWKLKNYLYFISSVEKNVNENVLFKLFPLPYVVANHRVAHCYRDGASGQVSLQLIKVLCAGDEFRQKEQPQTPSVFLNIVKTCLKISLKCS